MKRFLVLLVALTLCLSMASAASAAKVGVAMPTQSLQRWNQDGAYMQTCWKPRDMKSF
jgi:putative multiple sugar transport system substrate-binding protein